LAKGGVQRGKTRRGKKKRKKARVVPSTLFGTLKGLGGLCERKRLLLSRKERYTIVPPEKGERKLNGNGGTKKVGVGILLKERRSTTTTREVKEIERWSERRGKNKNTKKRTPTKKEVG